MFLPVPNDSYENAFLTSLGGSYLGLEQDLTCPNQKYKSIETKNWIGC